MIARVPKQSAHPRVAVPIQNTGIPVHTFGESGAPAVFPFQKTKQLASVA